jgi:hypothetical protein
MYQVSVQIDADYFGFSSWHTICGFSYLFHGDLLFKIWKVIRESRTFSHGYRVVVREVELVLGHVCA